MIDHITIKWVKNKTQIIYLFGRNLIFTLCSDKNTSYNTEYQPATGTPLYHFLPTAPSTHKYYIEGGVVHILFALVNSILGINKGEKDTPLYHTKYPPHLPHTKKSIRYD